MPALRGWSGQLLQVARRLTALGRGRHINNFVWAFNVDTRKLSRVATASAGAEMTRLSVVDDWNGFAYITSNYQHPGDNVADFEMKDKKLQAELISLIDRYAADCAT